MGLLDRVKEMTQRELIVADIASVAHTLNKKFVERGVNDTQEAYTLELLDARIIDLRQLVDLKDPVVNEERYKLLSDEARESANTVLQSHLTLATTTSGDPAEHAMFIAKMFMKLLQIDAAMRKHGYIVKD